MICLLISEKQYPKNSKINYNSTNLLYSRTKLNNGFIFNISTSFDMVDDENENTEKVLRFIQKNPGCHMRQIKKDLDLAMGTTQYHLNLLEKMGRIVSEKAESNRFFFPVGTFGDLERNILKILNRDSAREILLYIIEEKNPTQTDIANSVKISPGTANWHISKLLDYNIISEQQEGKFKKYILNGNPHVVISLLKNYHKTKWNSLSNKLAELFMDMTVEGDKQ
jgi:predicted transcriptional regulator